MDPAKSPAPWKPDPLCDWARFEVTGDALFWDIRGDHGPDVRTRTCDQGHLP